LPIFLEKTPLMTQNPKRCPNKSCNQVAFEVQDSTGESVCVACGTVLDVNNIVSAVEFQETSGGSRLVI
jgi:transcription initiation factor TFIIIB Brf1 subunit/transcription initiation factor TFIIB